MAGWRRTFEPVIRRLFHFYSRFARGLTMGVRALVLDAENRVFLVKHSYVEGWHLPGGGVEVNETVLDALKRELMEEGLIEIVGLPQLHGVYFSRGISKRDHVVVYVVRAYRQDRMPSPNSEIVACGFYSVADLPPDTTAGTRQRIAEVLDGCEIMQDWRPV